MTHATINQPVYPVPQGAMQIGITRRDWLAAMALPGVITQGTGVIGDRVVTEAERNMMLAQRAYDMADAMLAVAEKPTPQPTA